MLELLEFGVPVPVPLQLMVFGALAIAAGVAILKYRLYDIDVILSKTWSTGRSLPSSARSTSWWPW